MLNSKTIKEKYPDSILRDNLLTQIEILKYIKSLHEIQTEMMDEYNKARGCQD
jgi:hypothetical protein